MDLKSNDLPETKHDDFMHWKQEMLNSFSRWLDEHSSSEEHPSDIPDDIPDLFSVFSSLVQHQAETRKITLKTVDTISGIQESLGRIESGIPQKNSYVPSLDTMSIISLTDRIWRIQNSLKNPPSGGLFTSNRRWTGFHATITEAVDLLMANANDILTRMKLHRISTEGKIFDPGCMVAVETVHSTSLPDNHVHEELLCGYEYNGAIVRLAEVIVVRNKSN